MRIVIANSTDRWIGGIESYVGVLIPALIARGHDVLFMYEQDGDDASRPRIHSLESIGHVSIGHLGLAAAIDRVKAWRPDVIFAQAFGNPLNEAAVLGISPAVFFAHAYHGTCVSGSKTFRLPVTRPCKRRFGPACLLLYYPRRCGGLDPRTMLVEYGRQSHRLGLLSQYAAVVTLSEHMRLEYVNHGIAPDRVTRLPPVYPSLSVNQERQTVTGAADRNREEVRLCFVGRIERLKGLHLLLESLPHLNSAVPIRVTVAGDGPDRARCQAIADEVQARCPGIAIEFPGWVSAADCAELTTDSDVLVMPSVWPEPFGFAGAEAVQRGTLVAAFDVGAVREWLTDGETGAIAPATPPNAVGLAGAIARCLQLRMAQLAAAAPPVSAPQLDQLRLLPDPVACLERHLTMLERVLSDAM